MLIHSELLLYLLSGLFFTWACFAANVTPNCDEVYTRGRLLHRQTNGLRIFAAANKTGQRYVLELYDNAAMRITAVAHYTMLADTAVTPSLIGRCVLYGKLALVLDHEEEEECTLCGERTAVMAQKNDRCAASLLSGASFDLDAALETTLNLLRLVNQLHLHEVVHLNLRVGTVRYDVHGTWKLLGLGFAKSSKQPDGTDPRVGQWDISSPERLVGIKLEAPQAQVYRENYEGVLKQDSWSLGLILFKMYTGENLLDTYTDAFRLCADKYDNADGSGCLGKATYVLLFDILNSNMEDRSIRSRLNLHDFRQECPVVCVGNTISEEASIEFGRQMNIIHSRKSLYGTDIVVDLLYNMLNPDLLERNYIHELYPVFEKDVNDIEMVV